MEVEVVKEPAVAEKLYGKQAKRRFTHRIRDRLLKLILGSAATVMLLLGVAIYFSSSRLLDTQVKGKSETQVALAASKIDKWVQEKFRTIEMLAHIEGRTDGNASINRQAYFFDVGVRISANSIYLGYEDGRYVDGSGWFPPEGWDARQRPWYLDVLKEKTTITTLPYRDSMPPHKLVVTIATPVHSGTRFVGVLAMDVTIDSIMQEIGALKLGDSGSAYMVDESGLFITHSDPKRVLKANIKSTPDFAFFQEFLASRVALESYQDKDRLLVFARVPGTRMIIAFELPLAEFRAPLDELKLIFAVGILIALLILSVTISAVSRIIAQPILSLAEGANRVAAGEYGTKLEIRTDDELGFVTHSFNKMADELKDREFILSTFGRYVSEDVVQEILSGNFAMGGEKKLITILFSDIRGFTSYSEKMDPEPLVTLLNAYFSTMDAAIRAHGGSINKYMGDGIMALFGAPNMLENSAASAAGAALQMMENLAVFNKEHGTTFQVGIGIHTGVAVVGNIGSAQRTEYTVIGDSVNLTCRIEALTKFYGESILISDATAELLPNKLFIPKLVDRVRVVGKKEPVTLFAPLAKTEDHESLKRSNLEILEAYFQGDFQNALEMLRKLPEELSSKHLKLIEARCKEYLVQGPQAWDGVFTFHEKA